MKQLVIEPEYYSRKYNFNSYLYSSYNNRCANRCTGVNQNAISLLFMGALLRVYFVDLELYMELSQYQRLLHSISDSATHLRTM